MSSFTTPLTGRFFPNLCHRFAALRGDTFLDGNGILKMTPDYFTAREFLAQRIKARAPQDKTWIADVLGDWELPAVMFTAEQYRALQTHDAPDDESEALGAC